MKKRIDWSYLGSLAAAVLLALAVGAMIMLITGHDPVAAYTELVKGATGCNRWADVLQIFSKRQFGNTMEYAMVLFLTGLACAIGARVGIFNVGGEGQLYLGAIVSAYIGVLLTGLGWFGPIAKRAGAGTLVPITGFANSVAAPALEFKTEGVILGTCVKMFSIAGPVLVFGISASVVYGLIYYFIS